MTAQDIQEAKKQLEKVKKLLFQAIENKSKATLAKDRLGESRYLGEIKGYEEDVKYYQVIIKPKNLEGGEINMVGTNTAKTDEKPIEVKPEVKKEINRVVVNVKKITVGGASEDVEITTDTDSHEWQVYRKMRKLFRPLYEKMLKGEKVEVSFE